MPPASSGMICYIQVAMNDKNGTYTWDIEAFRGDPRVHRMNFAERGLYREMLDSLYLEHPLPDDPAGVADKFGVDVDEIQPLWARVRKMFTVVDGKLVNKKVERVKAEALAEDEEESERQRAKANKRWEEERKRKGRETEQSPSSTKLVSTYGPKTDFVTKKEPPSPPADVDALLAAFAETAGDYWVPSEPDRDDTVALSKYSVEDMRILGAHVAAGLHWAQSDGKDLTFGVRRLTRAGLDKAVIAARAWDKNGRKKATKTGMADPRPAVQVGGEVKL